MSTAFATSTPRAALRSNDGDDALRGYLARSAPQRLIGLGRVVEFGLEGEDGTERVLRFGKRGPQIAHDERGQLYEVRARLPRRCVRDPGAPEAMVRAFTDLHEGAAPCVLTRVRLPAPPKRLDPLGRITYVVYAKRTAERGKWPLYHHPFAPHARPLLARDERRWHHFAGGRYHTNTRGIVDAMLHANPRGRRASRRRTPRTRRAGFAYIANPATKTLFGSTKKQKSPSQQKADRAKKEATAYEFLGRVVKAGLAAVIFQLVTDVLFNLTPWSPTVRGSIQGATGVLLGLAVHQLDSDVGLGFAVAGFTDAISGGIMDYRVQNYMRSVSATPASTGPGVITGAGRVGYLPAGQAASMAAQMRTAGSCVQAA